MMLDLNITETLQSPNMISTSTDSLCVDKRNSFPSVYKDASEAQNEGKKSNNRSGCSPVQTSETFGSE